MSQFPNIIACVDGTHIKIIAPSHNEWEYVNRKGFHSINVQLMCDVKLCIVNCVVRWPGSTHDARILRESNIYEHMEQNHDSHVILGDSGYPLRQWLMVPFFNPQSDAEHHFNRSHMTA